VRLFQLQCPDEGIELCQLQRVVLDALLVVILLKIFRCRGPELAQLARAIEPGFAKLDYPLREILFWLARCRLFQCIANACSSELLIDVPDPTPFGETRRSLVSHSFSLSG
jgi:hypothetical protein